MNFQEFKENALKTESQPTRLNFGEASLYLLLDILVGASDIADQVKKTIFYGKPLDARPLNQALQNMGATMAVFAEAVNSGQALKNGDKAQIPLAPELAASLAPENINLRLLHGAIGMFGEAGELLRALQSQLAAGHLDRVNFKEEIGDSDWYKAILHDELDTPEEEIRAGVIAKLKARYGDKFSTDRALNRDLASERAILDSHLGEAASPAPNLENA
jgi:hypothetical protein